MLPTPTFDKEPLVSCKQDKAAVQGTTALVHRRRLELPTPRSEAWCSIH